jgi:hypothetical protein
VTLAIANSGPEILSDASCRLKDVRIDIYVRLDAWTNSTRTTRRESEAARVRSIRGWVVLVIKFFLVTPASRYAKVFQPYYSNSHLPMFEEIWIPLVGHRLKKPRCTIRYQLVVPQLQLQLPSLTQCINESTSYSSSVSGHLARA